MLHGLEEADLTIEQLAILRELNGRLELPLAEAG